MKHSGRIIYLMMLATTTLAQLPKTQCVLSCVQNAAERWGNDRLLKEAQPDNPIELAEVLTEEPYDFLKDIPSISPLQAGESPRISSHFGLRRHPIDGVYKPHLGIDLVCRRGFQFVYATANGRINFVGRNEGLGLVVKISHANCYKTGYGHLDAIYVRQGDSVRIGEVLGVMGSSGKATGVHLHYTISIHGLAVDPLPYLTLYEDSTKIKGALRASSIKISGK